MNNTCYTVKMGQFIPWFLEEAPRPEYWEDLYNEYMSLRENKSSLYMLGLVKEITYLKAKYNIIIECCNLLNVCFKHTLLEPTVQLRATLKLYGFRQPFDLANEMTFSRDLRAVLSLNKKTISTWQRKEKELEGFQAKHTGKAWTRKDFYVWAVTLTEYMGHRVDLDEITVAEWCIMLNKYERYCEVKTAELKGKQYGQRK